MNEMNTFEIKDYRQPVVTSLGIILGFLLGFLGQWVTEPSFLLKEAGDILTFVGTVLGVVLLFIALFKMLSPNMAPQQSLKTYQSVLRLYLVGVVVPTGSILLSAFI
jgi:hypothetical protein